MNSPTSHVTVDSLDISIATTTTTWLRRLKLSLFKRRASYANVVILEGVTGAGSSYLLEKLVPATSILDLQLLARIDPKHLSEAIAPTGPVGINEPAALDPEALAAIISLTQDRDQQLVLRTQSLGKLISQLLPNMRRAGNDRRLLVAHVAPAV